MDNDPNQEDTSTINSAINRPNSSTHLQSKSQSSNNSTNKQLADALGYITNTLTTNQNPGPNSNLRETKACISDNFSSSEPNKLNNFPFQCHLYFCTNLIQFDTDIAKINFTMIYCYNLKILVLVNEKDLVQDYTRKLDRELCTRLFTLYTTT